MSGTSLSAGASATFSLSFGSSSAGLKVATVSIVNDDTNENPFTFNVSAYSNNYKRCALGAVTTIAQQDFESSPATPIMSFAGTGGSFASVGGTAFGTNRTAPSNKFVGGRSYQITSNVPNNLTFSAVDATNYKNITLSFNIGAYAVTSAQGMETSDEVRVSISTNGGTSWIEQLAIRGNNNAIFDINTSTGSTINFIYDPTLTTGATYGAKSNSVNSFSKLFKISGLPNSNQLRVKFDTKFSLTGGTDEIWAIDNVKIEGQIPSIKTWATQAWTPAGNPTENDKVILDDNYNTTANGNLAGCECQINSGKTVTITSGNYIEIQSNLINNGNAIEIENGGSLVQYNDYATNLGNINITRTTRNMNAYDYIYWGSPVQGNVISQIPNFYDVSYMWNINGNSEGIWIYTSTTSPGIGFITSVNSAFTGVRNFTFSGQPNNGIVSTFADSNNNGTAITPADEVLSGNTILLGNPYPSAIDAQKFLTDSNNIGKLGGTLFFWTATTPITNNSYTISDYASWNLTGGTGTAPLSNLSSGMIPNGKIATGQGFFAQVYSDFNVTFNNSMRTKGATDNLQFFRTATIEVQTNRIWLNLYNQNNFRQTLIGYLEGATNDYENLFDGNSFTNNAINIYSIVEDRNLVIQGRALPFVDTDTVPLGYKANENGVYNIAIDHTDGLFEGDQNIYLEDLNLNVIHDIKAQAYSFSSEIGTFNNRFVLRYTNATLSAPDFNLDDSILVYKEKNALKIISSTQNIENVTVYDMLGRTIFEAFDINDKNFLKENLILNQQTLIVKVKLLNGLIINKKIIY